MPPLWLYTLGPPRVRAGEREIQFHRRKTLALIVYLTMSRKPLSRGNLAAVLWPECDRPHALASLRQCLMELSHGLGESCFELQGDTIEFSRFSEPWVDAWELRRVAHMCRTLANDEDPAGEQRQLLEATQAVALYRGTFLEGFTLPDSIEFDDWQSAETLGLRDDYLCILRWLTAYLTRSGNHVQSGEYSRRLLSEEPADEAAHQALMRALDEAGEQHAAIRQYHTCAQALAREYGANPSPETARLYREITSRQASRSGTVSTETKARNPTKPSLNTPKAQATEPEWVEKRRPTQKSRISKPYWVVAAAAIALLATLGFILTAAPSVSNGAAHVPPPADMAVVVMPFDGLGSDHTAQWTGRGLTELLTTELVWLEAFNITTRPPAARYSYPPPTPRQIARDLGVRYIVEGAVLATNSGLMVVARLIDAESEAYLWRSQYVAQGDDLLLFLKDTAGSIASAVFDALSPEGATQNQEVAR